MKQNTPSNPRASDAQRWLVPIRFQSMMACRLTETDLQSWPQKRTSLSFADLRQKRFALRKWRERRVSLRGAHVLLTSHGFLFFGRITSIAAASSEVWMCDT